MLTDKQYTQLWFILGYAVSGGYCKEENPENMIKLLEKYDMTKEEKAKMLKMVEFAEAYGLCEVPFLRKADLITLKETLARESQGKNNRER